MKEGTKLGEVDDESPEREQGSEKLERLGVDDITRASKSDFITDGPQNAARNHIDAAFLKLKHLRLKVRFDSGRESI
jgi:hypothetical protein